MNRDQEFGFCPELVQLYKAGFAEGANGERFALGGCSTANNLATLRRLFEHHQPKQTLEIGLCLGGSCLLFTALHQRSGVRPSRQHTAIDPFQISMWKKAGLLAIQRGGLNGYLDFRENLSSLELPRLAQDGQKFDFIYVDGSHLFEDVFIDFYYVARLLCDRGIVAFDDCADPNVAKVLGFITRNLNSALKETELGPYRSDGGRTVRYRAGKLLGRTQMRAFQKVGPVERQWDAPLVEF